MAEPTVWEGLPKSQGDPTTISEEVAAQIDAHNVDPDAHMDELASLQDHRTNATADHPAESVVNDKLQPRARAYVALVGTGADGDFDTIQAAIAYAITVGGGTIFIAPGDYYFSNVVEMPMSINLRGADRESTRIHGDFAAGDHLRIVADTATDQRECFIEHLTVVNDSTGAIDSDGTDGAYGQRVYFEHCTFEGGGFYFRCFGLECTLNNCDGELTNATAFQFELLTYINDCAFTGISGASNARFADQNTVNLEVYTLYMRRTMLSRGAATNGPFFSNDGIEEFSAYECIFTLWQCNSFDAVIGRIMNCNITLQTSNALTLTAISSGYMFCFNFVSGGSTPNLIVDASNCTVIGNSVQGLIDDNGAGNLIAFNRPLTNYTTVSSSTTAVNLANKLLCQLTPNSTRTLTTDVPSAGQERVLIILTSGTTSYTLTFGSGFKSTGTLATGATSARRFVIRFISDGTQLIETSRTTAIA